MLNKLFNKIDTIKAIKIITIALASILILFFALDIFTQLRNPFPDNFSDGSMMLYPKLLMHYGTYFFNIHTEPYIYSPYPPVFIYITALLFKLFGASFLILRLLSLLAGFGIAYLVYQLLKEKQDNFVPLIITTLFFVPSFITSWLAAGRTDTLAILFAISGLFVYSKYPKKMWLLVLLYTLAFYTRQTAIVAAGAIFFDQWLVKKEAKAALTFAFSLAGTVIGIMLIGSFMTNGEFYMHLISYNKVVFINWNYAITKYIRFFRPLSIFVAIAIYGLLTRKVDLFGIFLILHILVFVSAGKDGASANYFIEPYVSLLLYCGFVIKDIIKTKKKDLLVLILLLITLQAFAQVNNPRYYYDLLQKVQTCSYSEQEKMSRLVKHTKGPILSEETGFLTMHDKPIYLSDTFYFPKLAAAGIWDPHKLIAMVSQKQFTLVIAGERIKEFTPLFQQIRLNYRKVDTILDQDIYIR